MSHRVEKLINQLRNDGVTATTTMVPSSTPATIRGHRCSSTKEFTYEELRKYNGVDDEKIYTCLYDTVFDITTGRGFYGPGGSYHIIAGKNGSKILGKMKLEPGFVENPVDLSDLTEKERGVLDDWFAKFQSKYPVVGKVSA